MILVIDVGNTNITFGVFDKDKLVSSFRLTTGTIRTSDEYGMEMVSMLRLKGASKENIEGIIIASVVPKVMHSLVNAIVKYIGKRPYIVGPGIKTGIKIATDNPREVGPDLIVDAVAAFEEYGGPVLVVDFGTATSYIMVNENGELFTGVFAPGIRISAQALWQDAAKLPEIEIKKPKSILAKETISSMQAGLIYGQIGQAKYIIQEMIRESGLDNVKVIATGGMGRVIAEDVSEINLYEPTLTLKGLYILYKKNKRIKPQTREFDNESIPE